MPYIGRSPTQAVRARYYYTVAADATSVTGSDDNSNTLIFSDGEFVDVSLNGVTLVAGTDYNTTTANTIAGISAMALNDVVEVVVYDVFSVFDGNVNSDFSVGGDLTVTGETVFTSDIRVGSISGNKNIIIHPANNSDARLLFREGGNIASGFNEYSIGMDGSADEITIATQGGGVITRISDNGEVTFSAEDPANASFNTFNSSAKTINNYKGTTDGSAFTASSSNTTTALAADNAKGQIGTVTNHPLEIRTNNTVAINIDATGAVTKPLQPAFSVNKNDTAQSNFAAGASEVTVTFSAARFDQGSDFDLSNNRFVAPVTGKYQLNLMMRLENIDSASSYYVIRITTSNRAYEHLIDPDFGQDNVYHPVTVAVLADMDANDTATIFISQGSGTVQTDISGNPGYTNFTGFLAC
jgi:hypothetical protein